MAVDVEGRIGLGIAEPLRILQTFGKRQSLLLHPRQDVVAGAVENAIDAVDAGRRQALAKGLDDRDCRADGGFEVQGTAMLFGSLRQPDAVLGDQRLVGRDD